MARMSPTSFPSHSFSVNFPTPEAPPSVSAAPSTSSAPASVDSSRDASAPTNTANERSQKERAESNLLNRLERMFTKHFQHIAAQMMKERSQREAEEKEKFGLILREINGSLPSLIRRELDAGECNDKTKQRNVSL